MNRIFFVGDIHGCSKTFRSLVTDRISLTKSDHLYCVGDYIDRGPDSRGVVDFILALRKGGYKVFTLRGNHEQMLLDSENSRLDHYMWLMNGGDTTLKSFGISTISELDNKYLEFFNNTEFYISDEKFIAVHAGLDFDAENPLSDFKSLLWIRDFRIDRNFLGNRILVHGHTPVKREVLLSQEFDGRVNVDGGCVYNKIPGMGYLYAFDLRTKKFITEKNCD